MAGAVAADGHELPVPMSSPGAKLSLPTTFGRVEPASSRDATPRDAAVANPQGFQAACAPLTEKSEVRSLIQIEHQKTRTYLADLLRRSASTAQGELAEHHQALRELVDGAVARQAPAAGVAAQIRELQLQVQHLGAALAPGAPGPDGADGAGQQQRQQRQESQCTSADEADDGLDSARKEPGAAPNGGGEDWVQLLGRRSMYVPPGRREGGQAADELASTRTIELLHSRQTESLLATQSEYFDRLELMVRQALIDYTAVQKDGGAQGKSVRNSGAPLRASRGGRGNPSPAGMTKEEQEAEEEESDSGEHPSIYSALSADSPPRQSVRSKVPPRPSRNSVGSAAPPMGGDRRSVQTSRRTSRRNAGSQRSQESEKGDPADVMALRWINEHVGVQKKGISNGVARMLRTTTESTSTTRRSAGERAYGCKLGKAIQLYSTFVVVLYICYMGIQVDQELLHMRRLIGPPIWSWWCDLMFALCFTIELFARVYVDGWKFIHGPNMRWNLFDTLLITTHLIEVLFRFANFGILRALTGFRAIRAARLVRSLGFVRELRLMVCSIRCSLRSVGWAFFLISFIVYLAAISTMQYVEFHFGRISSDEVQMHEEIFENYGRLGTSMLSLFMAISGGDDWRNLSKPLELLSPWCSLGYVLYIVFLVFGIMNILTAIFVESAKQVAEVDKELAVQEQMFKEREVVESIRGFLTLGDKDNNGLLSKEELERMLESRETVAMLKIFGWGPAEARGLFQLLDVDEIGEVSIDEFTCGMLRLKGAAKSLDIATMMYENKRIFSKINLIQDTVARNHQEFMAAMAAQRKRRWDQF